MDPTKKKVTVSLSKLMGFVDGVLSNAQKLKSELEAAKQAKNEDSFLVRLAKSALSSREKPR